MEWQTFFYCCCRREALWVVEVQSQFCLSFGISKCSDLLSGEVSQKNALPWRIPMSILLSSCLSCHWAFNLKLDCRGGYRLLRSVANVDRLMSQNVAISHAIRYSNSWICRAVVEVGLMILEGLEEFFVKVWVSGAPIHNIFCSEI